MFEKSIDYTDSLQLDTLNKSFNNIPAFVPDPKPSATADKFAAFKAEVQEMAIKADSSNLIPAADTIMVNGKMFPKPNTGVEVDLKPGLKVAHFYELLDSTRRTKLFRETGTAANMVQSEIINVLFTLQSFKKKEILHWQQFYQKYTLALSCIIFLFIGAPMGAIVRKGGFGYPLLIAIIFFIIYIMASKLFEKLTDSLVLQVEVGVWMTTLLISACGVYLTYRASKDVSSNFLDILTEKISKFFSKKNKQTAKAVANTSNAILPD
jgi:hypothetical protein